MGVVLAATGCGADGGTGADGGAEPEKTLTKAEFVERADRICAQTDKLQKKGLRDYLAKRPAGVGGQALNEKAVLAVGLPAIQVEAKELSGLPAPDGDEDQIQAILAEMEKAIDRAEEDPGKLVNLKSMGPFTTAGKLARKYGFKACAFPL